MATSYPDNIDSFPTVSPDGPLNVPPHDQQHNNANDAIVALQTELGTNPSGSEETVKDRLDAGASRVSFTDDGLAVITGVTNVQAALDAVDSALDNRPTQQDMEDYVGAPVASVGFAERDTQFTFDSATQQEVEGFEVTVTPRSSNSLLVVVLSLPFLLERTFNSAVEGRMSLRSNGSVIWGTTSTGGLVRAAGGDSIELRGTISATVPYSGHGGEEQTFTIRGAISNTDGTFRISDGPYASHMMVIEYAT